MQDPKARCAAVKGPAGAGVYKPLTGAQRALPLHPKKLKWFGKLVGIQANIHPVNAGKKQVPACRMGAQDRPGIAQRYGPIRVKRWEYDRQGLAEQTAVWSAVADLTGGLGRISDGSGILLRKKDIADSAGRRQCPKH